LLLEMIDLPSPFKLYWGLCATPEIVKPRDKAEYIIDFL